jgi:hypothetical protein
MIRSFCILFLTFAYVNADLVGSYAQVSEIPNGWKKVSLCQLHFLIPKNMKNQNVKGIDSCVADFKNSRMRLAIDYGSYSGAYKNDGTTSDFKEEFTEIDGKKAQLVTFKDRRDRKFVAGLYVLIHEAQDGMKTSLNMSISVKSEEDLETARHIFQSLRFDKFTPFTVEWE